MTIASASSGSVRPIETRSLSEQVTNEIRRSILAGALPPGQSLSLAGSPTSSTSALSRSATRSACSRARASW